MKISISYNDRNPTRWMQVVSLISGCTIDEVRSAYLKLSNTNRPVVLGNGKLVWDGITDCYTYEED